MGGFDTGWLDLREPADASARNRALIDALSEWANRRSHLAVVDLGCGTGANFRALSPRLPAHQDWTMIDNDPVLLEQAGARLGAMAAVGGYAIDEGAQGLTLCREDVRRTVRLVNADIAAQPENIGLPEGGLVTCSALLDLVGAEWLESLIDRVIAAGAAFYAALEIDGRIALDPVDIEDERILAAFRRDQERDKGFGPALGPAAAGHAAERFRTGGYRVRTAQADWRLDSASADLAMAWLTGLADAAGEPEWLARRMALVKEGRLLIEVGHTDLLALPAEAA